MAAYFEIDRKKELVLFKDTDQLALLICGVIEDLRKIGGKIDDRVGKFILQKTPGKTLVKLGVRLALHDNAFNYGRCRMEYPGYFGPVSRMLNALVNSKLGGSVPPTDLAAMAVQNIAAVLLERACVPAPVIQKTAQAIGCAVSAGIKYGDSSHVDNADKIATYGLQKAHAGLQFARLLQQNPPSPGDYIALDSGRHLITFNHTDKLAQNINQTVLELRNTIAGIPEIGAALGSYVIKNTPGEFKVNRVVGFLNKNAFNYQTMQFEYQGGAVALTRVANSFINSKLDAVLSVSAILEQCIEVGLNQIYLSKIPDEFAKAAIVKAMAAPLLELIEAEGL